MSRVEKIQEAVKHFYSECGELSHYGASDPDAQVVFRSKLRRTLKGARVKNELTAAEWGLHATVMDCSAAAARLNQAANTAIDLIANCLLGDSAPVLKFCMTLFD